jgi:hypothetical protein
MFGKMGPDEPHGRQKGFSKRHNLDLLPGGFGRDE